MRTETTYTRRKAAGLCPRCGAPRSKHPRVYDTRVAPTIPGPALAHCGGFHAITTLPACCGTCGAVVLKERT